MRSIIFFISLILFLHSADNAKATPTSNLQTQNCLNAEDAKFVNKIITMFEAQLEKQYGFKSYRLFLSDVKDMSLPPEFFIDSKLAQYLIRNKGTKTFKDIWEKEEGIYSAKPDGHYFKCLKKECTSKTLKDVLEAIEKMPGISPGLLAEALASNQTENEYTLMAIKKYIAVNIYSEFAINIYDETP